LLKTEAAAGQAKAEKRIEQLNSAIERERAERAVAEGALEATRADYARLQREIAAERSLRRRSVNAAETFDADQAKDARPSKNGNGAGHSAGSGEPPPAARQSGAA
jgi:multidrug resistance efflux pump